MKINTDRFDAWASSVWTDGSTYTPGKVAKLAGISRSSFYFQRNKGYVEASVVLALSRGLGRPPLGELLKFDNTEIFEEFSRPTDEEVLSQIGVEHLMEELLARLHGDKVDHHPPAPPEPHAVKRWLDAAELHGMYSSLSEAMGLSSQQVLSKKLTENRLTIGELAALCVYGELNGRFGLVVTGMMTFEEVGYPFDIREQVLKSTRSETVVEALWGSRKWVERAIQVKELENGVHQGLG